MGPYGHGPVRGMEMAVRSVRCSGARVSDAAARFALSCSTVRAPRIAVVTPGCAITQASATFAGVVSLSAAICRRASRISHVRSSRAIRS